MHSPTVMCNKKRGLMKIKLILGIFILNFYFLHAQQDSLNPNIKNESTLNYERTQKINRYTDVVGATYCFGTLNKYNEELLEIGIKPEKLKNDTVQCTVGDFDGNGYLDFALWGLDKEKKTRNFME